MSSGKSLVSFGPGVTPPLTCHAFDAHGQHVAISKNNKDVEVSKFNVNISRSSLQEACAQTLSSSTSGRRPLRRGPGFRVHVESQRWALAAPFPISALLLTFCPFLGPVEVALQTGSPVRR